MNTAPIFIAGALGLGGPEVLMVFAILLLLFGGSKLPELAKGLGKSIKEFKHASSDEPDAPVIERRPSDTPAAAAEVPKSSSTPDRR